MAYLYHENLCRAIQALFIADTPTTPTTPSPEDSHDLSQITPQYTHDDFTDMMRALQVRYQVLVDRFDALNDHTAVVHHGSCQPTTVAPCITEMWKENTEYYTAESRKLLRETLRHIDLVCQLLTCSTVDGVSSCPRINTSDWDDTTEDCERITWDVRRTTACIARAYRRAGKIYGKPLVVLPLVVPNFSEELLGPLEALWGAYDIRVGGDQLFPHRRDSRGRAGFRRFIGVDGASQCKLRVIPVGKGAIPIIDEVSVSGESSGEESDDWVEVQVE